MSILPSVFRAIVKDDEGTVEAVSPAEEILLLQLLAIVKEAHAYGRVGATSHALETLQRGSDLIDEFFAVYKKTAAIVDARP